MTAFTAATPCFYCGKPRGLKRQKTCTDDECRRLALRDNWRAADKRKRAVLLAAGVEMLRCAICGEPQQAIGRHVSIHGMSLADYRTQYPGAPLSTPSVGVLRGKGGESQGQSRRDAYQGQLPDPYLAEFLTGVLLGDGHLECRKKNARYAEGGSNELYLRWKHSVLQRYFPTTFDQRLSAPHVRSGKRYQGWWIKTSAHPLLTEAHAAWYSGGIKGVPANIVEQHLTEFALAVWFCDDGCSLKDRSTANLYTMAFQLSDVEFLQELLFRRFSLSTNILFNKKRQPYLSFGRASRIALQAILQRVALPGMDYKALPPPSVVPKIAAVHMTRPRENSRGDTWDGIACRFTRPAESTKLSKTAEPVKVTCKRCKAQLGLPAWGEARRGRAYRARAGTKGHLRGQYVKRLVDEGAGMMDSQIGVVTCAGPKQFTVCWESGQRESYPQDRVLQQIGWHTWTDDARRAAQDRIFRHCGIIAFAAAKEG